MSNFRRILITWGALAAVVVAGLAVKDGIVVAKNKRAEKTTFEMKVNEFGIKVNSNAHPQTFKQAVENHPTIYVAFGAVAVLLLATGFAIKAND